MSCIGSVPFSDPKAEKALCEHYGAFSLERAICDGQKGYTVVRPNGVRCFHYRLRTALREILEGLGHGDDRELLIIGEPETGNAWRVDAYPNPLYEAADGRQEG